MVKMKASQYVFLSITNTDIGYCKYFKIRPTIKYWKRENHMIRTRKL
jgi:hypothetical protein